MNYVEAVVLGIVQGLTEFLPISSTAHLRVVPQIFGWPDPGAAFTAVIQLGTMAAVLLFFWRDLVRIAVAWVRSLFTPSLRGGLDARMGWYIILGTIPIAVFGFAFKDQIETGARDLRLIGWVLILFGVILWAVDRFFEQRKEIEDLLYAHPKVGDVAVIGLPDRERGERVCAVVERAEGQDDLGFDEMVAYLGDQQLARFKTPEQLVVVDALPRNNTLGKILKYKLREQYAEVPWP